MSKLEKLSQEKNKPKTDASGGIFMSKSEIEALREEAELIESELEEDPFIDSMDPPKELYNRIVQELKDKGIYHEDESSEEVEEKEEVVEKEKKKVVFYTRWQRAGKWVAIVCLSLLGVFGVAMTSEANRAYIMQNVETWFGSDVDVKINNNSQRMESDQTEKAARESIENELNITIPKLGEIPKGMKYKGASSDPEIGVAIIEYEYKDDIVYIYVTNNQKDTAELSSYDGKLIKSVKIYNNVPAIDIWEIKDDNDKQSMYLASWEYKNCYYEITGKMEKDIFVSMIEKISF